MTGNLTTTKTIDYNGSKTSTSISDLSLSGFTFRLKGTSYGSDSVNEVRTTNANGVAQWLDIPVGNAYVLSEELSTNQSSAFVYYTGDQDVEIKYNTTVTKSATNKLKVANVKIQKTYLDMTDTNYNEDGTAHTDEHDNGQWKRNGRDLSGFMFKLTGTPLADSSQTITAYTVTTNADGEAVFENVPYGTYTLTEELTDAQALIWDKAPSKTITISDATVTKNASDASKGTYTADGVVNSDNEIEYLNTLKTGSVTVTKSIETAADSEYNVSVELREDGVTDNLHRYNESKAGFVFRLNGTSDSGIEEDIYAVTNESGVATFSNILTATDSNTFDSDKEAGIHHYTITEVTGQDLKESAEGGNPSAIHLLSSAWYVDQLDGNATAEDGKSPLQSVRQYVAPEDIENVTVEYGEETTETKSNELIRWTATFQKQDMESYASLQYKSLKTKATFEGAIYGLYDGDQLIARYTTDENGVFEVTNPSDANGFVLGDNWYMKELSASEGYLIDPVKYYIDATVDDLGNNKNANAPESRNDYLGTNVNVANKNVSNIAHITNMDIHGRNAGVRDEDGTPIIKILNGEAQVDTVYEQVKKSNVQIWKYTEAATSGTSGHTSIGSDPVEGAGFTVFRLDDVVKAYGLYNYATRSDEDILRFLTSRMGNELHGNYNGIFVDHDVEPAKVYSEGEISDTAVEYYSEYYSTLDTYVNETVIPSGYSINPSGTAPLTKEYTYTYEDENGVFQTKTFTAENENEYIVAEFYTNSLGLAYSPMLPYGDYLIVETTTPEGKLPVDPVIYHVTEDYKDATVYGDDEGLKQGMSLTLVDEDTVAYLRIRKTDTAAGLTVQKEGAKFLIYDDDERYVTWRAEKSGVDKDIFIEEYKSKYTYNGHLLLVNYDDDSTTDENKPGTVNNPYTYTANGTEDNWIFQTPMMVPTGHYTIVEIGAPDGYVLYTHEGVFRTDEYGNTFWEAEDITDTKWDDYDKELTQDDQGIWDTDPDMASEERLAEKQIYFSKYNANYDSSLGEHYVGINWEDDPVVGKISVYVEGERLSEVGYDTTTVADRVGSDFPGETNASKLIGSTTYSSGDFKNRTFTWENGPAEGAVFEVRAKTNIVSADGRNAVLFNAGQLVTTLTTDENGEAHTEEIETNTVIYKGLPLGTYEITQVSAGNGMVLPEDDLTRTVTIRSMGEEVPIVYKDEAYQVERKTIEIAAGKYDSVTQDFLNGAVIGLVAKEDIKDKDGNVVISAGELVALSETYQDEKAAFYTDKSLPVAEYSLIEFSAPTSYKPSDEEIPLYTLTQYASEPSQKEYKFINTSYSGGYKFVDSPIYVYLRLADLDTDAELSNGIFVIKDSDGNTVTSVTSVAYGENIIRGLSANETYTVEQTTAPSGYDLEMIVRNDRTLPFNKKQYDGTSYDVYKLLLESKDTVTALFTVTGTDAIQVVNVFNSSSRGKLVIEKHGLVPNLDDEAGWDIENKYPSIIKQRLSELDIIVNDSDYRDVTNEEISYEDEPLPGAAYYVVPKEDIYYPDGITNPDGSTTGTQQPLLRKNERLTYKGSDEFVTSEDGTVSVVDDSNNYTTVYLFPGTYEITEVKAPNGYHLATGADAAKQTVTIEAGSDSAYTVTFNNDVQTMALELNKAAKTAGEDYISVNSNGEETSAVEGARYALFAEDNITNINGKILIGKGVKVDEAVTDADGHISWRTDLPLGDYIAFELEAPLGYCLSDEIVEYEGEQYKTDNSVKTLKLTQNVTDDVTVTIISLHDLMTEKDLAGAVIKITDTDGNAVSGISYIDEDGIVSELTDGTYTTCLTNGEGTTVYGLVPGETYKITEVTPRENYAYNLYDEDGTALGRHGNRNEYIFKVPADEAVYRIDLYNKFVVADLTFEKLLEQFHIIADPDGGDEVEFAYTVDGIKKDIVFRLVATEDIYHPDGQTGDDGIIYRKSDDTAVRMDVDEYKNWKDAPLAEASTNGDGTGYITGLFLGNYKLVEVETPDGYAGSEPIEISLTASADNYSQERVPVQPADAIENLYKKVSITLEKRDSETATAVSGATYSLYCYTTIADNDGIQVQAGQPLQTKTTDEDGKIEFDATLPAGYMYYVQETKTPAGYALNDTRYDVDSIYIASSITLLTQKIKAEDDPVGLQIVLMDNDTKVQLDDAVISIKKDGDEVYSYTTKHNDNPILLPGDLGLETGAEYTLEITTPRQGYTNTILTDPDYSANDLDPASLSKTTARIVIPETGGVHVVNLFAEPVKGVIRVRKEGNLPQAVQETGTLTDLTYIVTGLPGAEYRITPAEGIDHPDGYSDPIEVDDIILTTNENGDAETGLLPLGVYTVTETKAPRGYIRDKSTTEEPYSIERTVDLKADYRDNQYNNGDYDVKVTDDHTILFINKMKIVDIGDDDDPIPDPGEDPTGNLYGLAGLFKVNQDGDPITSEDAVFNLYTAEQITLAGQVIIDANVLVATGTSDSEGRVRFLLPYEDDAEYGRISLPVGRYYAVEASAPHGYYAAAFDLRAEYTTEEYENDDAVRIIRLSETIQDIQTKVTVTVQDDRTHEYLDNVTFRIVNEDGETVTDNDGNEIVFTTAPGKTEYVFEGVFDPGQTYTLVEEKPANNYTYILRDENCEPIHDESEVNRLTFTIPDEKYTGDTDDLPADIYLPVYNEYITGSTTITKTGDQLVNVNDDGSFEYDMQEMDSVVFELYALSDIKHPDGWTEKGNSRKLSSDSEQGNMYDQDELVDTQETKNGKVSFTNLFPGTYYIVEAGQYDGYAYGTDESRRYEFEIKADPDNPYTVQRVTDDGNSFENYRQKVKILVRKYDEETNELVDSPTTFELRADGDIYTSNGRSVLYRHNETVEEQSTTNGEALFGEDGSLPLHKYTLSETKAPYGYVLNTQTWEINATYDTTGADEITITQDVYDEQTKTVISVLDKRVLTAGYSGEDRNLTGTKVSIYNPDEEKYVASDGSLVDITDPAHIIEITDVRNGSLIIPGLDPGTTYILTEEQPREGYKNNAQTVNRNLWQSTIAEEGYIAGDDDAISAFDLQPSAYSQYNQVTFTTQNKGGVQVVTIFNDPVLADVLIEKTGDVPTASFQDDAHTVIDAITWSDATVGIPGAEYELTAAATITYPDGSGEVVYEEGDLVAEVTSGDLKDPDSNGLAIVRNLYPGKYTLSETKAPRGYSRLKGNTNITVDISEAYLSGYYNDENHRFNEDLKGDNVIKTGTTNTHQKVDVGEDAGDPEDPSDSGQDPERKYKGKTGVYKTDTEGNPVKGAAFTLYAAEDIIDVNGTRIIRSGTEIETTITDETGRAVFTTDLPAGKYSILETKAPAGYYATGETIVFDTSENGYDEDDNVQIIRFRGEATDEQTKTIINVMDRETLVELDGVLLKLTDEDGNVVSEFDLDGNVVRTFDGSEGGDITTVHDGNIIIRGLEPGKKYIIEEVKPREKYSDEIFIDNTYESKYVQNGYDRDQVRFDKDNVADLYLRKEGSNKVSFVTGSFVTGTDAAFQVVSLFNEQVKATVSVYKEGPVPSVTTERTVTGTGANKTYENVVTGINWDTVAGLPGSEFELYAREDIEHPDGYTGLIASSGDKIADLVTGKDGRDSVSGLTIGSYGIRETKAPEGYARLRDENISDKATGTDSIYEEAYAAGSYSSAVSTETTFFNPNQFTDLGQDYEDEDLWDPRQIVDTDLPEDYIAPNNDKGDPLRDNYKKTGVYKYGIDQGKKTGIANAKFTLYAEEDITDINGKILIYAGTKIETSWSQAGGRTYFDTYSLPAGKYKVVEEEPPAGYYSTAGGKSEVHFDTTGYAQDDEVQVIRLSDSIENEIIAVRVFLEDTTTKVELEGASLTVTREDGKVIDSFITSDTDGEGYVIKGMFEPGYEYTITENFPSNSSYTYILMDENGKELDRDPVQFDSNGNIVNGGNHYYFTIDDTDPEAEEENGEITIYLYNSFVTGYAYIHKSGEVLKTFDPDKEDPFEYESEELAGVKFGLYAAEDIYHPDGKTGGTDPEGNQLPLFKKGELVNMDVQGTNTEAVVETDTKGTATFTGLYPGQYEYREMENVDGFAKAGSGDGNTFSIVPDSLAKQTVMAQEGLIELENYRQKVNIRLTKLDKDSSKALKGAEFTLYAGEDLYNENGEFLVDKDEAITKAVSDENGIAAFTADLPPALYYVKETKAPSGYVQSSDKTEIDASWRSDGRATVTVKKDIYNQKTAVSVSKVHDGTLLKGAKLAIYDKTGKSAASWTTDSQPHIVEGLLPGETYTLKELSAPAGYVTADDVVFTVNGPDSAGNYETQEVQMEDEPTIITIRINEINAKGQTTRLGDVEWHLETASGSPVTINGTKQAYTSEDDDDVVIEKIPVGNYKIIIDSVPEGYLNPGTTTISVADTTDMQYFHVDIPFTAIEIIAINKDTRKIIRKVRADVTDESGVAYLENALLTIRKTKVDPGDYTVSVTQGPTGYLAPEDTDITVRPVSEIQKFYIEFGHTTIRIEAVDEDTGDLVGGVIVDILNESGVPVATNVPLVFAKEYVSSGNYTVAVKSAPTGYRTPDDTSIFVQQTEDLQVFKIPIGTVKASVRAISEATNKPVSGVYLTLKDPKGEVYAKWTTEQNWKLFKPITPGSYMLEAVKVPSQYGQPKAKQLKIENISDMQYFEIDLPEKTKETASKGNAGSTGGTVGAANAGAAGASGAAGSAAGGVSRPQTGDDLNLNVLITAACLIVILLAGAYVMQRRKKKHGQKQQ